MVTTETADSRFAEQQRLEGELAVLSAHLNAATARWLRLVSEARRQGLAGGDDFACWLGFRCGISLREARGYLRVAEALEQLPVLRGAFERGELSFCKVRALTRVATPACEQGLLELAAALTASQLERALGVFRRLKAEQARDSHELEYLDYYWEEDGSLVLRARLPAEDGTLLVHALDAARERLRARRRQGEETRADEPALPFEPQRSLKLEALVELAAQALARPDGSGPMAEPEPARLLVHVDAGTLTADAPGRCEMERGPVIAPETARRLGCDAEHLVSLERDGLPLSLGRTRRCVPPRLRRLLEARDQGCCRWPGCDNRHRLAAHHRRHWAHGGETSLPNLVLLCFHHHRLVHEGGYTIEDDPDGKLGFRNRHGLLCPSVPRSPPGSADQLIADNIVAGLTFTPKTNRNGAGERMTLDYVIDAIEQIV
jgi:hypothetical protein